MVASHTGCHPTRTPWGSLRALAHGNSLSSNTSLITSRLRATSSPSPSQSGGIPASLASCSASAIFFNSPASARANNTGVTSPASVGVRHCSKSLRSPFGRRARLGRTLEYLDEFVARIAVAWCARPETTEQLHKEV